MKKREISKLLDALRAHRREREAALSEDEPTDPRIVEALERGMRAVRELDPIVRETMRENPAALAEWDDIMHDFHELDREDEAGDAPPPTRPGKGH